MSDVKSPVNSALSNEHASVRASAPGNQDSDGTFFHGSPYGAHEAKSMKPLVWLGIGLIVAWAVLWLGIKMAVFAVHLLLLIGVALIGWGLFTRRHASGPSP